MVALDTVAGFTRTPEGALTRFVRSWRRKGDDRPTDWAAESRRRLVARHDPALRQRPGCTGAQGLAAVSQGGGGRHDAVELFSG